MKKAAVLAMACIGALGLAACGKKEEAGEQKEFEPRLDTAQTATLEISGFMGNFEALDQAINAFQQIYPNVTFFYDHNSSFMLPEYLASNSNTDIFMADDQNIRRSDLADYYVAEQCLDLSGEDFDLDGIFPEALADCTVDGKLLRLPVAMNTYGIVVNKTLLKKEGLSVPQNYEEFLSVLAELKQKGYTPLQGSDQHLYGELVVNMAMNLLAEAGTEGDIQDAVLPALECLETIMTEGYTDYELNCTYPVDNYDGSIMAFFEGNMPFYVCNAECVSGMKKRESKSESFSAAPFEYEYIYAPLGEKGAYAYEEPWYGFAVNKDSEEKELAVEFLRFLMQPEQLENMAAIKGLPSVTGNGTDERYTGLKEAKNIQAAFLNDSSVSGEIRTAFLDVCRAFGAGEYKNAGEAAKAFGEGR